MRRAWTAGRAVAAVLASLAAFAVLTGCHASGGSGTGEQSMTYVAQNPTAESILSRDREADIFQLDGVVYRNAEEVDWVREEELTIGDKAGSITRHYEEGKEFADGMATHLPVGTELHRPVERGDILIAIIDGNEIRYLKLVEG